MPRLSHDLLSLRLRSGAKRKPFLRREPAQWVLLAQRQKLAHLFIVIIQASQPAQNNPDCAGNELEELLALAEGGIDRETREFIDEVLKFVPKEPEPEIRVFTSHLGASYAC